MDSLHKKNILDELIFFITRKCNFRCKTCFYAEVMDNRASQELDIEEIRKISSSIGEFNNLLISGGEPFLRDDLAEIAETFYLQNKISHIHLPTNGFYPEVVYNYTSKVLHRCSGLRLTLVLSLDGLPETHDKIKGVKGSFDKVIETARRLSNLKEEFDNLNIYIITVVNNMNLNEIIRLSEFVKNNLSVDGHGPSPLRGTPYDRTISPPSYREWKVLAKELMKYHRYWNEKVNRTWPKAFLATNRTRYLYKIYSRVLQGKRLPFRCQAGNIIGVLEPDGEVRLCELREVIGNVRSADYDFREVWTSDRADDMRKGIKGCACTHACFLGPSIELHLPAILKSLFWNKLDSLIRRR